MEENENRGFEEKNMNAKSIDRRGFLKGAGLAALGIAGAGMAAGCSPTNTSTAASAASGSTTAATVSGVASSAVASASTDFKADKTIDADICVVGIGAAGCMAALTAAQAGAKVVVLEKGDNLESPNGMYVSGPFAIGSDVLLNKEGGSTLNVDEVFQHVMEYTHWTPNPPLMHRCLEESKNAITKLEGIGYTFKEANFRFETPFKGVKGGFHLITNAAADRPALWQAAFDKAGVELHFKTPAVSLVKEGEMIAGVNAIEDGSTKITVNAKAVILTTGGYLGNRDLQERFLHTRKLNVARGGISNCTGDGILAAEAAGVALEKTFGYCPCEYGGTNSKASRPAKQDKFDQNTAFKFGLYGNLLVDAEGNRFINEGLLCDYPMSYGSEQILRNSPWYGVVDQAYVDAMKTEGLYAYTTAKGANSDNWFIGNYFNNPDRILTKLDADLEEGIKEGWCYKANTIKELGEFFGLTNLEATVKQYNEYCAAGVDPQYDTNPWYLSPVATPPFYVTQNEPSAWSTFGGIRTDINCNALNIDNQPIKGLYAAGTDVGSLYYSPYYDVAGYCYGLCCDSGLIAGTEAAAFVK